MPKISSQKRIGRSGVILAAAADMFAEKGFERASVAEIAASAGISDGLVYRYFSDKRDLLMAVLVAFYIRVIDDMEEAVREASGFREKIRAAVHTHVRVFAAEKELCRLFLTQVRSAENYRTTEIYALNRRYTSILIKVAADGIEEGAIAPDTDPRLLRDMLFGGVEHFAWRYIAHSDEVDLEDGARKIADVLLEGFCGRRK